MLGETLEEIDGEIGRLECALRGLQKLEPEVPEPETLVTRTLTLEEGEKNGSTETVGYLAIYVDDLLLVGDDTTIHEALEALGNTFTLAAPEFVTSNKTVTFC
eukprot:s1820_g7.t1